MSEGSKHSVKHTVRNFLRIVGLTWLKWIIVAVVKNRARVELSGEFNPGLVSDLSMGNEGSYQG